MNVYVGGGGAIGYVFCPAPPERLNHYLVNRVDFGLFLFHKYSIFMFSAN